MVVFRVGVMVSIMVSLGYVTVRLPENFPVFMVPVFTWNRRVKRRQTAADVPCCT